MSVDLNILKAELESTFKNAKIDIYDEAGDGKHFFLNIITDDFKNLSSLDRHKLVYNSLKKYMPYIHALSINAKTYNGD